MLEPIALTRVVTTPDALDAAVVPADAIVMRTAPDEALIIGDGAVTVADPHAIVVADTGWHGVWLDTDAAERFLQANCAWKLPAERSAFAQGRIADAPVKLWIETDRMLFLVPHVVAHNFGDRLAS